MHQDVVVVPKVDVRQIGGENSLQFRIYLPALVLAIAAATAIFRFNMGMLTVLGGSCAAGVVLRLLGLI